MNLSRSDQHYFYNNLIGIVKALEGQYTIIDLRDESYLTGKISRTDGYWNVEMEDVIYYDNLGIKHKFDNFFIKKRNIRYVHIPEGLSTEDLINKTFDSMTYVPREKKANEKKTYKKKRALLYQESIVQEAFAK